MPKRLKQASKPIETDAHHDISDSQKKHYEKLGYRPYLSHGGKIKWLSFEQHVYEKIKYADHRKLFSINKIHAAKSKTKTRKNYRTWLRFLQQNWILLLILLGVIFMLLNIGPILSYLSNIDI